MQGVNRVLYSDLFWESLSEFRNTPYYRQVHANIRSCIANKLADRNFKSATDEPFSAQKELQGIWHARVLGSPLRLLFYTIEGDTLQIGSVGTHDDYGWKGKNSKAAERLVERIRHSIAKGHVPFPAWEPSRWSDPAQLTDHPDISVMSFESLRKLDQQLLHEYETLVLFKRKHGERAVEDVDAAVAWMEKVGEVRSQLVQTLASRPFFERKFRDTTPAECAMLVPSPEVASRHIGFK
ncbi:hypothetical protein HFO56_23645 [Rhizobium laguerreae]|uniref:hypothetical protein n=1 Tax=Rhizobium laguerreae TaxID=1076926 RepID=UPI001C922B1D|nr:hypothetical protein [Rhizobium laguerreae]MBY3155321.1 hypothetical protein [Rhizobium laguerreae]